MPAILGYVLAQQYNQNNATPEASPLTSTVEWLVGQQLCQVIGYTSELANPDDSEITGWGHLPADGSLANLESIWYVPARSVCVVLTFHALGSVRIMVSVSIFCSECTLQ